MTNPLVSVIMPVFNTEKYVREAIESVLGQTYTNIEVICVDDGSTDGTMNVLDSFGDAIRIVRNPENAGIATSRNNGIAVAKGELLAFMDADDLWQPEKLAKQVAGFVEDSELDMSFTHMQCFISQDLPEEVKQLRECNPDPIPGYISATAVVKTTSFLRVGLFNPKWRVGEFIDWIARANEAGLRSAMLPGVHLLRRIHATNTGVTERPSRADYVRIVKEALERRKKL